LIRETGGIGEKLPLPLRDFREVRTAKKKGEKQHDGEKDQKAGEKSQFENQQGSPDSGKQLGFR